MSHGSPHRRPHHATLLRGWGPGLVLLALMGCAPSVALAEPSSSNSTPVAAPIKDKIEIELMVVHATNAHERVDPELRPVLQHLRFLQFKGFTLLSLDEQQVAVGAGHTFPVVGGRRVTIDVIERDDKQVKMRVRMFKESGMFLDTTIRIHRNKSFMVGGPDHDGGKLLLPITAHY